MRAIVLSAGQGRRLLPLTASQPKCLLPVTGHRSALELQLRSLARCGIDRAFVVVGFGAERVEKALSRTAVPGMAVETLYNPFFSSSDNLVTCWLARFLMTEDFVLLNGDTLFEDAVVKRLLESPAPISVTIDRKSAYDDDDMKVSLDAQGRLRAIGKTLGHEETDAESIGFLAFRGSGTKAFQEALDAAIRRPEAMRSWYLSVVHELAQRTAVSTASIEGMRWCEIDSLADLEGARAMFRDPDLTPEDSGS